VRLEWCEWVEDANEVLVEESSELSGSSNPARNLSLERSDLNRSPFVIFLLDECSDPVSARLAASPPTGLSVWCMKANALAHVLDPLLELLELLELESSSESEDDVSSLLLSSLELDWSLEDSAAAVRSADESATYT
jgi:hypothetical protein